MNVVVNNVEVSSALRRVGVSKKAVKHHREHKTVQFPFVSFYLSRPCSLEVREHNVYESLKIVLKKHVGCAPVSSAVLQFFNILYPRLYAFARTRYRDDFRDSRGA